MNSQPATKNFDSSTESLFALLSAHDDPESFARALFELDYRLAFASDPDLAEMMRACAIPSRFDARTVGVLRDAPAEAKTNARLLEKLRAFNFVITRKDGHYVYHDNTRKALLEDWKRPANRRQYTEYRKRLLDFYISEAMERSNAKEYAAALTPLNLALEVDPKNPDLHYQLGVTHYFVQDYKAAHVDFSNAARLSPRKGLLYHWRGITNVELQDMKAAVADFTRAIDEKFDVAINCAWRGMSHLMMSRYKEALADLNRSIRLKPEVGNYHYWRGVARYHLGRYKEALNDISEAIRLEPKEVMSYHWRGVIHYERGDYREAVRDFSKGVKLDPKIIYNHYYRALSHLGLGKHALALEGLEHVCEVDPARPHPLFWRGVTRSLTGDEARARKDWEKAGAVARGQTDVCEQQRALAKLALLEDDEKVALKHYRSSMKRTCCKFNTLMVERAYLEQLSALMPGRESIKRTESWFAKRLATIRRRRVKA